MQLEQKKDKLLSLLQSYPNLAVGFSGGVDSTFLLCAAREVMGKDRVLAITVAGSMCPQWEREEARTLAKRIDVRQIEVSIDPLSIPGFRNNDKDRCYHCKRALFNKMKEIVTNEGFNILADGANTDDLGDYRPGMVAIKELGIVSPLLEVGLNKKDIRELSREYCLPTADKPSYACLASRIPYGTIITIDALKQVEQAESFLMKLGFSQMRVRHHGLIARIEVPESELFRFMDKDLRLLIVCKLKELGFRYISLDLQGFRTGSMNESL